MKSSKRIAFVANTSWSIYNFRLGVLRKLKILGYNVIIIAPKDNFSARLVAEGFSFYALDLENYSTNPWTELASIRSFYQIYRESKPDFIFHFTIKPNIYGSFAASLLRIPSISITTGLGRMFSFESALVQWITIKMYRLASKWCKEIWFLNESDRQAFLNHRIVPKRKTRILPSEGIDTNRFRPVPEDFELKNRNAPFRFLYAGRILWDKGIKELAQAAKWLKKKYPNVEVELLGFIDPNNSNAVPYWQILNWQNRGWIKYLGEVVDVRYYLSRANCLVLPSYREGMSRILMEAASMAKPIITSDTVGCREVVEDGVNGLLCKPQSGIDLAHKMEEMLLLSTQTRLQMGLEGRRRVVGTFDEELIINRYLVTIRRYFKAEESFEIQNINVH